MSEQLKNQKTLKKITPELRDWLTVNKCLSLQARNMKKVFWDSHNKVYKLVDRFGDVFNISLYDYEYIVGHYDIPHKGIHDKKYIGGK